MSISIRECTKIFLRYYKYAGITLSSKSLTVRRWHIAKYLRSLDGSIFLDALHFPMKNIKSCDLEATPMGGATSTPASDAVCFRDVGRVSP